MRIFITLTFLFSTNLLAKPLFKIVEVKNISDIQKLWDIEPAVVNKIKSGEVFAESKVKTIKKKQSIKYFAAALHPQSCARSFRKLSLVDEYQNYLSYVKSSKYFDNTKVFQMKVDHMLLPFPMVIDIKIEKPSIPKTYPFYFLNGILKNLKGKMYMKNIEGRCLYYIKAKWRGRKTIMPDAILELASQTLTVITTQTLFRVSNI